MWIWPPRDRRWCGEGVGEGLGSALKDGPSGGVSGGHEDETDGGGGGSFEREDGVGGHAGEEGAGSGAVEAGAGEGGGGEQGGEAEAGEQEGVLGDVGYGPRVGLGRDEGKEEARGSRRDVYLRASSPYRGLRLARVSGMEWWRRTAVPSSRGWAQGAVGWIQGRGRTGGS